MVLDDFRLVEKCIQAALYAPGVIELNISKLGVFNLIVYKLLQIQSHIT